MPPSTDSGRSHSRRSAQRLLTLGLKDPSRREPPEWLRTARSLGHQSVRRLTRQRYDGGIHTPPPPPPCPPGWRTGPPSFVGLGGQRCGTTRWFELLASHPEVVPPPAAKELDYFDRFYAGGFTAQDAAGYHVYFPRDGDRKVGEWSPLYMSAPWVPRMLAQAAPQTRLLVLLRDPVERLLSSLQHNARVAHQQGTPLSELAPLEGFMRGLYHAQLVQLLRYFDRSQLLVLQYERCTAEPLPQLRRTFEFIGLRDVDFVPDLDAHPHRQPRKPQLDEGTREAYVAAYREDVRALAASFTEIDLTLWPNFADLAA